MRTMRGVVLATLLAVAGLMGIASPTTQAQVIDSTPCQAACYEQEKACVGECGRHTNPVECEAGCRDQLEDCLRECR